ncbi:MAG: four helix bundle protein [Minisyncoccia bacterium]
MAGGYRELIVWQKAMDLVEIIYRMTEQFPKSEMYGLTSQMRRCSVSIPSNIAEGSKRRTKADFKNFLSIALGSTAELETQLMLAKRIGFVDSVAFSKADAFLLEITKILTVLITRPTNDS